MAEKLAMHPGASSLSPRPAAKAGARSPKGVWALLHCPAACCAPGLYLKTWEKEKRRKQLRSNINGRCLCLPSN